MKLTKQNIRHQIALNNEGGAPGAIQLIPANRVIGRDGRWWVNDNPQRILDAFTAYDGPIVIDYEHANWVLDGQPTPAAGWINTLEIRDGEIWGLVEWTEKAATMIVAREYRFISPVFSHDENNSIHALLGAGLTNQPNLKMTALNRRDQPSTHDQMETTGMDKTQRIALCKSLGLADEASNEAIMTAINKLKDDRTVALNKASTPDQSKFVPRADYDAVNSKLTTAMNTISAHATVDAEAAVDAAITAGKIAPASRDYHVAACKAEGGLESFNTMVGASPQLAMNEQGDANSQGTDTELSVSLNREQLKICEQLNLDPKDPDTIAELAKIQ